MNSNQKSAYHNARRFAWISCGFLIGIALLFAVLHLGFADLKEGGVRWFNLDKERNIPTWFSAILFLCVGCAGFIAYHVESRQNAIESGCFRIPILWFGVGLVGLAMSLDEMTILHENLFWREIRVTSSTFNEDAWKYLTQWQILFGPAICVVLAYFAIFFSNRLSASKGARRGAFIGIGCWIGALILESLRETFKGIGDTWYSGQVLMEEGLEMMGAIFLLTSMVMYLIDITMDITPERRKHLETASKFLTMRSAIALCIMFAVLATCASGAYFFANRLAQNDAKIPRVYRKALKEQADEIKKSGPLTSFQPIPQGQIWVDDLPEKLPVVNSEVEAMMRYLKESLLDNTVETPQFPDFLTTDKTPQMVFISLSDGSSPAVVVNHANLGFESTIAGAVSKLKRLLDSGFQPQWLKLDVVTTVKRMNNINLRRSLGFERSLAGLAFSRQIGIAFLPEELLTWTLMNSDNRIRPSNISSYLYQRQTTAGQLQQIVLDSKQSLFRITTASFFTDGIEIIPLYRGHRLFKEISPDELLTSAVLAGEYLKKVVNRNGRFTYKYLPKVDKVANRYNILRHAGTIYSMLELYEHTNDLDLLEAAKLAINYLVGLAKSPKPDADDLAVIVEDNFVKLGGNALAVVALAKYMEVTKDKQYLPVLQRLASWIASAQEENGRFYIHKQAYPNGEISKFVSGYYPGEAILALTRIHALDGSNHWLDVAEKAANYLITIRDKGVSDSDLPHDHWLLYALNDLYRSRPNPLYLNHSRRIANAIVNAQNRNPPYPDWLGSYSRPPKSTRTAIRSEGLFAAYKLLRDFGDPEETQAILDAIILGVRFQLQTQFRPETAMYVLDPQRCIGGFKKSLTDFTLQIDYTQHNLSGLLGLYKLLGSKK